MHTIASIQTLLDRSVPAVIRGLQVIGENGGFKPEHDEPMRKFIAMFERDARLTYKQEKYARSVAKHQAQLLADVANAAMPQPAIIPSVTADEPLRYSPVGCDCENHDGERLCPWCEERGEARLIQELEALEEERRMAIKFAREDDDIRGRW